MKKRISKNNLKTIMLIIAIIIVLIGIVYVGFGVIKNKTFKKQNPIATIEVENYGTIKIELYPDQAPNTVSNFIKLANNGFYDNLTFHRTIPSFMIQGGDKSGDGTGTPTLKDLDEKLSEDKYAISGEFLANGYKNTIKMEAGTIVMARSDYSSLSSSLAKKGYDSAGSQFFITTTEQESINGMYAAFGKVIEGMDIVEKIANTEVYYRESELGEGEEAPKDDDGNQISSDTPKEKPVMTSVKVETYGVDYGMPETVEPFDYYTWMMKNYYGGSSN